MSDSVNKLESIHLGKTSGLRVFVWKVRRNIRELFGGKDVLDVDVTDRKTGKAVRKVYRTIDGLMGKYFPGMVHSTSKDVAIQRLKDMIDELEYTVVDADETKPWGAFYRMKNSDTDRFLAEFFPGLSLKEAKLGNDGVELSPKFLLVLPGQRLSWQYHDRRAERWRFLSDGAYFQSNDDEQRERTDVTAGEVVQFARGERHRLCALNDETFCLVAEIWQHTEPAEPSNEDDIVRLADDYKR